MYRMDNSQWDNQSDDEDNSLNSSFWSDGEREEDDGEEVEVEVERGIGAAEDSLLEASEEEKPELNNQGNESGESWEGGNDDDEERCSSSSDSPAPSLMTSGYGTYRPEEQEGGDFRDDHTVTEFDQDSRGDLSEMRDDEEDDRSLCSFGGFDIRPTELDYDETRPLSVSADADLEADVACCGDDGLREELDISDRKPEEDEEDPELEVINATSEEQTHVAAVEDTFVSDGRPMEAGSDDVEGGKQSEGREEEVQDLKESEDPDESSSNKDIKFIDSKVDLSWMTSGSMCEEWEGNLRQKKDAASCLDERLAELHLSTSAHRGDETENEDVSGQSDAQSSETDGISLSAFESYIRGMTRAQSDGDVRPKPKSFIRPVMSQQTIKKTDPVAKYFQYKQLWEMFKLPGEQDRRALRWEVKERLAYQPPPPKPRRVYVPNTYIVPTEKKRSALRWEVRNDLANGLLPHKFSYRF